jgi:deoxyadenosine/deoxycytidine kinase
MNTKYKPIRIIEVVGPAGAGKSSLANALSRHRGIKLVSSPPYYRKFSDIPFFARNTLELLPTFLKLNYKKKGNWLSMRDMAWMVILKGWHRVFSQKKLQKSILILDEGPIFHMALLQIYGSESLNNPSAQVWWGQMYKRWSKMLDMVVFLDAPDSTLIERIRAREKPHGVKIKGNDYAIKYLTDLREKYDYLLCKLTSEEPNLKVLRFDTLQISLDQVCLNLSATLYL